MSIGEPRVRSSAYDQTVPGEFIGYNSDGSIWHHSYYNSVYYSKANYMEDWVVPDFYTRSKAGEVFNNPCLKRDTEVKYRLGSFTLTGVGNPPPWYEGFNLSNAFGLDTVPHLEIEDDDSTLNVAIAAASTKAMAKVTSEEVLLGATLGELKDTKDMLMQAYHRLTNLRSLLTHYRDTFNDVRKSPLWKTKKGYDILESAWMQVRFGWRPFISEVSALYKAMNSLKEFPERQTFRAREYFTITDADNYQHNYASGQTSVWKRSLYATYKVSSGVLAEQRYGGVPDTYGLTKFPQTIYELTKLSWFLDYFFNIGDVIAAYTPDSLWNPLISWTVIRAEIVQEETCSSYEGLGAGIANASFTPISRSTVTKIYRRFPSPPPGLTFLPKLSWAKYIDTGIVARQLTSKLMKTLRGVRAVNPKGA